ncbi:Na+/H+ antiporter subunit E [Cytobacillus sp. FJAT-54145]|uniref:Na+/H+ antiporter subunit E n=1 Tax=Cytobacillus spartinae TaxID=3299023 RepID=A0ABW6KC87_9BACI
MKKNLLTFFLTLALWFIFAGRVNIEVFSLGIMICSIISFMYADQFIFAQTKYGTKEFLKKIYIIIWVILAFIYDVYLSAFKISRHAFEMKPSFSSRKIRIKTSLKSSNSSAILAHFITLTQGTLALDFDHLNKSYFIHWIDVQSDDEAEVKKALMRKHENLIAKIFD